MGVCAEGKVRNEGKGGSKRFRKGSKPDRMYILRGRGRQIRKIDGGRGDPFEGAPGPEKDDDLEEGNPPWEGHR